jgi:hypothetical protein
MMYNLCKETQQQCVPTYMLLCTVLIKYVCTYYMLGTSSAEHRLQIQTLAALWPYCTVRSHFFQQNALTNTLVRLGDAKYMKSVS